MTMSPEQATGFAANLDRLVGAVEEVLLGKNRVVRLAFSAFLSEGHLLLDDVPGTGKTSLARAMAQSVSGVFEFHPGPIFANIVLADEINRASPKTQSALLEVMEESQVTVDGQTHPVGHPFMVIATQNPVEQAGTYRLPEAQLDRFLMRSSIGYPDHASTIRILEGADHRAHEIRVEAQLSPEEIVEMAALARTVYVDPTIHDYVSRLVDATRTAREVRLGVSVRGALALIRAAKTHAAGRGRHYVVPDDVKMLAEPVLAHRLILDPEAEFDGVTASNMIAQVLIETPPPSTRQVV
jgi:MoxR-like ATPase